MFDIFGCYFLSVFLFIHKNYLLFLGLSLTSIAGMFFIEAWDGAKRGGFLIFLVLSAWLAGTVLAVEFMIALIDLLEMQWIHKLQDLCSV